MGRRVGQQCARSNTGCVTEMLGISVHELGQSLGHRPTAPLLPVRVPTPTLLVCMQHVCSFVSRRILGLLQDVLW